MSTGKQQQQPQQRQQWIYHYRDVEYRTSETASHDHSTFYYYENEKVLLCIFIFFFFNTKKSNQHHGYYVYRERSLSIAKNGARDRLSCETSNRERTFRRWRRCIMYVLARALQNRINPLREEKMLR